jgi:hypothetical protein
LFSTKILDKQDKHLFGRINTCLAKISSQIEVKIISAGGGWFHFWKYGGGTGELDRKPAIKDKIKKSKPTVPCSGIRKII